MAAAVADGGGVGVGFAEVRLDDPELRRHALRGVLTESNPLLGSYPVEAMDARPCRRWARATSAWLRTPLWRHAAADKGSGKQPLKWRMQASSGLGGEPRLAGMSLTSHQLAQAGDAGFLGGRWRPKARPAAGGRSGAGRVFAKIPQEAVEDFARRDKVLAERGYPGGMGVDDPPTSDEEAQEDPEDAPISSLAAAPPQLAAAPPPPAVAAATSTEEAAAKAPAAEEAPGAEEAAAPAKDAAATAPEPLAEEAAAKSGNDAGATMPSLETPPPPKRPRTTSRLLAALSGAAAASSDSAVETPPVRWGGGASTVLASVEKLSMSVEALVDAPAELRRLAKAGDDSVDVVASPPGF